MEALKCSNFSPTPSTGMRTHTSKAYEAWKFPATSIYREREQSFNLSAVTIGHGMQVDLTTGVGTIATTTRSVLNWRERTKTGSLHLNTKASTVCAGRFQGVTRSDTLPAMNTLHRAEKPTQGLHLSGPLCPNGPRFQDGAFPVECY